MNPDGNRPVYVSRILLALATALFSGISLSAADYLFYHDGTTQNLIRSDLDGANGTTVLTYRGSLSTVSQDGVLVDPVHNKLYINRVFNDTNRGFYYTDFAGNSPVRISSSTDLISGYCIDLVNSHIYYHDDTAGAWYRADLDGSNTTTLASYAASWAQAAVDARHNRLYYTRTIADTDRGLYITDLAMSTAGTRISSNDDQITGLAIDYVANKIYYNDYTAGAIVRADLDGSNPTTVKSFSSAVSPICIDIVNRYAYYYDSNLTTRGLYRTSDLDSFSNPTKISSSTDFIGVIGTTVSQLPATPSVTGVTSSSSDGAYKAGATLSIQVAFSSAVNVTGTPTLTLETGATDQTATYASGTGTTALTFTYTVQAGDTSSDLDYTSTSALSLNGGTINATSDSAAATLTLPGPGASGSLGANQALVIDTTAPTISIGSPSGSSTIGLPISYTVTYSGESSITLSSGDITVNSTGTAAAGSVNVSGSGSTRTVTLSSYSGEGTLGISISAATASDTAGNVAPAAGPATTFAVDAVPPQVASIVRLTPTTQQVSSSPVVFRVTFSEAVQGVTTDSFTVSAVGGSSITGTVTAVSGSGTTYDVTVTVTGGSGEFTLIPAATPD